MRRNVRDVAEARVGAARGLRRQMTPAEEVLWRVLRDRNMHGLKFRRQHVFGPYVLDFCCPSSWLVVELDGGGHDDAEQVVYDAARTEYLNAHGYRVIRFSNEDVFNDLPQVLARIRDEAKWSGFPPTSPPRRS